MVQSTSSLALRSVGELNKQEEYSSLSSLVGTDLSSILADRRPPQPKNDQNRIKGHFLSINRTDHVKDRLTV